MSKGRRASEVVSADTRPTYYVAQRESGRFPPRAALAGARVQRASGPRAARARRADRPLRNLAGGARATAHARAPAVRLGRPLPGRPAPVLRLDPRVGAPRADRQPLRPGARRPRLLPPGLLPVGAAARRHGHLDPALVPLVEAAGGLRDLPRFAALRAAPAAAGRPADLGARTGAVRGHAGLGVRRLDPLGRQPAPVHLRLH